MNNFELRITIWKLIKPVPAICERRPAGQREKVFQRAVSEGEILMIGCYGLLALSGSPTLADFLKKDQRDLQLADLRIRYGFSRGV